MEVIVDIERQEIHFQETIGIEELAVCLNTYFPEDIYSEFKVIMDYD